MADNSFNIELVIASFEDSLHDESDVRIDHYVKAYEALSRLFTILGMIFSFVESDVREKREILRRLNEKDATNYLSVKSMVEHEIMPDAKPKDIGSRTLLRLHRALEFLIVFVKDVHDSKPSDNVKQLFQTAYDQTLSHHHGFFIRKAVGLAAHAVPNRDFLINVIFAHGDEPTAEQVDEVAGKFVTILQNVYDRVQVIYEKNDILNLP